ncbi:AEL_collapsed_G0032120.mRNA.1.CDS.1 [Saccharomyces cerevisiae]|nr:AEL_collapsed_G0032120.mRNA.1.CDS.1 [Saccharomyces cerevisiae]
MCIFPRNTPFPNPSVGKESDAQLAVPPLDPGIDLDLARKFDLSRILHDIGGITQASCFHLIMRTF